MKTVSNILALICIVFTVFLSINGQYDHAAFVMGLGCFNRINGMEAA